MLGALGILGTLIAGLSMPSMLDRGDSDDDRDAEDGSAPVDTDDTGESPLSVALAEGGETPDVSETPGEAGADETGADAWWGHDVTLEPETAPEDAAAERQGQSVYGTVTDDTLDGAEGDDTLFGDYGDDFLSGDAGDDHLSDGAGDDTLIGGAGDDTLSTLAADGEAARDGQDSLSGGDGDDLLVLSDHDLAEGGAGADVFAFGPGLTPGADMVPDEGPDAERAPVIEDFDETEDALVVIWDDYGNDAPPELTLAEDPETPDTVRLMGNGTVLAVVQSDGDVSLDAVRLQAASGLTTLGKIA